MLAGVLPQVNGQISSASRLGWCHTLLVPLYTSGTFNNYIYVYIYIYIILLCCTIPNRKGFAFLAPSSIIFSMGPESNPALDPKSKGFSNEAQLSHTVV